MNTKEALLDLQDWAKTQGLAMTPNNITELRALRNTSMKSTNSRRSIGNIMDTL